ncbi:superoxide dismutase family protein [Streptomyces sp. NPDC089799]|uniref:superoxide dismutase family protein n=1 Tax=Streptomyces sp. NPDC089799 TaxID=3155066 RepID=UPI0034262616
MSFLLSALALPLAAAIPFAGVVQDVTVDEQFRAGDGKAAYRAVTFDPKAVPAGARVTVIEHVGDGGATQVELKVQGAQAHRTFGAHVHRKPCGAVPDASGPHYQDKADPKQPSTDPAYANPRNEVWLDFGTDAKGDGSSAATVDWRFRPGEARSVVIHEHATEAGHGTAGKAGDRLACVNVSFE